MWKLQEIAAKIEVDGSEKYEGGEKLPKLSTVWVWMDRGRAEMKLSFYLE